jgi:hypothetical protein
VVTLRVSTTIQPNKVWVKENGAKLREDLEEVMASEEAGHWKAAYELKILATWVRNWTWTLGRMHMLHGNQSRRSRRQNVCYTLQHHVGLHTLRLGKRGENVGGPGAIVLKARQVLLNLPNKTTLHSSHEQVMTQK